jgi:hypothetical protein
MRPISILLTVALEIALSFYPNTFMAAEDRTVSVPDECTIRMDQASVVELARRAALSREVDLNRYELRDVSFEFFHHRWTVSFDEKSLSFDGCFHIFVDDETGQSEFRACP